MCSIAIPNREAYTSSETNSGPREQTAEWHDDGTQEFALEYEAAASISLSGLGYG